MTARLRITDTGALRTRLLDLAAEWDDHADDVSLDPSVSAAERRAAGQLRLVATLVTEGVYDVTTAYVWLRAGRKLLDELRELSAYGFNYAEVVG